MARRFVTLLVDRELCTLVFAFAGCGGDDNSASGDTTTTETTTTEETTTDDTTTETDDTETTDTETTDTTETSGLRLRDRRELPGVRADRNADLGRAHGIRRTSTTSRRPSTSSPPPHLSEIKADFETLADYMAKVAEALQGVDLNSGRDAGSAGARQAPAQIDSTQRRRHRTNIAKWVTENCTGTTP